MALIPCPDCGRQVSPVAKACPECGRGIAAPPPERRWSPGVAAVLSFVIPGAGQLYKGQVGLGLLLFVLTVAGYFAFVAPGIALHLFTIISAASGDPTADPNAPPRPPTEAELAEQLAARENIKKPLTVLQKVMLAALVLVPLIGVVVTLLQRSQR